MSQNNTRQDSTQRYNSSMTNDSAKALSEVQTKLNDQNAAMLADRLIAMVDQYASNPLDFTLPFYDLLDLARVHSAKSPNCDIWGKTLAESLRCSYNIGEDLCNHKDDCNLFNPGLNDVQ